MSGIQGPTSGTGGVNPRRIGESADARSSETGSLSDPSPLPIRPVIDSLRTGTASGQRTGASFKSPGDTADTEQAATTTVRQSQERPITEEWSDLVSNLRALGFSRDQLDQIVGSRGETEDTLRIFRQLQQLCDALRIDSHRTGQQVPKQLGLLPAQLVTLVKAGGTDALDALDALKNASSNQTDPPSAGELCELLQVLGTIFGHSYKQLADISLDNADALSVLREVHEDLEVLETSGWTDMGRDNSEALQEQRDIDVKELGDPRINEMRKRTNKLGALAHRGGVAALRALTSVALTVPSPSPLDFDDALVQALRATGLKLREIECL